MENRDYKIFKEKINQINFENENVDNTLKKEFSTIFDLDKFDINNFTHYLDTQNKILLNKNILIHKNHSEIISQIDKATTLSLDKNINEIKEFQTNFEKERALVNQELTIYKENYKEEVFNLRINNETNRSENYAFYEEEISQILVEEKSLRNKYLIEFSNKKEMARFYNFINQEEKKLDIVENKNSPLTDIVFYRQTIDTQPAGGAYSDYQRYCSSVINRVKFKGYNIEPVDGKYYINVEDLMPGDTINKKLSFRNTERGTLYKITMTSRVDGTE